jgi:uncharacterized protein YabE (DUF348 family)
MNRANSQSQRKKLYLFGLFGFVLTSIVVGVVAYNLALDRVVVKVDGKQYVWRTLKTSVRDALAEKGINVKRADLVSPDLDEKVTENLTISIQRAFPVTISAAGVSSQIYTTPRTVREVLTRARVNFSDKDKISPGLEQFVTPNMQIFVVTLTETVITQRVALIPGTQYMRDRNLERGTRQLLRPGEAGIMEQQYKVFYENGREVKRIRLMDRILKPAVNAIIALGIKSAVRVLQTSRGSYRYLEVKAMEASAYSPGPESCGKYAAYGRTYTGKRAGYGLVAVDPRVIPMGTRLYIEGYGAAEAADKGSAIKGNRIDLCYETYREAVMFGRRRVRVYILE